MLKISLEREASNFELKQIADNLIIGTIRRDSNGKDRQWFQLDVLDVNNSTKIILENVLDSSYPEAWQSFVAVGRYDGSDWEPLNTELTGNDLEIELNRKAKCIQVAYFVPYTLSEHQELTQRFASLPNIGGQLSCTTSKGNSVELFRYGNQTDFGKNIWIISRQHSGESNTGWIMEGVVQFLEEYPEQMASLSSNFTFNIIHNVNPDGVEIGAHRTNTNGIDLNRGWMLEDKELCPELSFIKNAMADFPPYLFVDIHGDERIVLPYVNIDGNTLNSQKKLDFVNELTAISNLEIRDTPVPDRNIELGRHYVNHQFDCVSLTIESACQYQRSSLGVSTITDYQNADRRLGFELMETIVRFCRKHDSAVD